MKEIVLICLYSYESIGFRNLNCSLLDKGFDVTCIYFRKSGGMNTELPTEEEYTLLFNLLKELKPSIIGVSTLTGSFSVAKHILNKITTFSKALKIVGGIHTTIKPEDFLGLADVICFWEGDESIPELCSKFFKEEDYTNIPNLWVKKGDEVIKNPLKLVLDLDTIPLPDFNSGDFYYIDKGKLTKGGWEQQLTDNIYRISTSRGCPNRCTYCINNTLAKKLDSTEYKGKYVRVRNVDKVIKELEKVKQFLGDKLKVIKFHDEVFGLNVAWLKEFVPLYKEKIGLPFWCHGHISVTTEEKLLLLKEAGLKKMNIGLESACESFRNDVYKKYFSNDKVIEILRLLRKHNIFYAFNMMMGNPLETDDDLKEGVRFLSSLGFVRISFFSLVDFPETELTKMLIDKGYIKEPETSLRDSLRYMVTERSSLKTDRSEFWYYIFNLSTNISRPIIIFLTNSIFIRHPKLILWFFRILFKLYASVNKKEQLNTVKVQEVKDYWEKNIPQHWYSDKKAGTKEYYEQIQSVRYKKIYTYFPFHNEYDKHRNHKVLEIGYGQGTDLLQYAKNGAICYGIDLTESARKKAKRMFNVYGYKCDLSVGNAERMMFKDNTFDLVYSYGMLHHTPHPNLVLQEVKRILKDDGKVIFNIYSKGFDYLCKRIKYVLSGEKEGFQNYINKNTEFRGNSPLTRMYSKKEVREMFSMFDKVKIKKIYTPSIPSFLGFILGDHWLIKCQY